MPIHHETYIHHGSISRVAKIALKSACRHLERKYISTHSVSDYKILRAATNQYHKVIARAKRQFNVQLIQSSILNPHLFLKNINSLLHRKHTTSLPSSTSKPSLAESFSSFLSHKVCVHSSSQTFV